MSKDVILATWERTVLFKQASLFHENSNLGSRERKEGCKRQKSAAIIAEMFSLLLHLVGNVSEDLYISLLVRSMLKLMALVLAFGLYLVVLSLLVINKSSIEGLPIREENRVLYSLFRTRM